MTPFVNYDRSFYDVDYTIDDQSITLRILVVYDYIQQSSFRRRVVSNV